MFPFPLLLGAAASTAIFSAITIILCFVPYPQKTLNFLATSPLATSSSNDYGSSVNYYTATNNGYGGYSYATPLPLVYTTTRSDAYGTFTYTETSYFYADSTDTANYYYGSSTTPTTYATRRAEPAPAIQERQQVTSASATSSSTSAPALTPTSLQINQTNVGPIYSIWLLIVCVLLFVQSASLLAYTVKKRRMIQKQEQADVNEGIVQPLASNSEGPPIGTPTGFPAAVPSPQQPFHTQPEQQQQPPPTTTSGQAASPAVGAQNSTRTPRVTIAYARCHFACLVILALLLIVPIGFLMNVVIDWHTVAKNGVSDFASSPFLVGGNYGGGGSYALGAYLASGGCNATAGGSSNYYNNDYSNPCDGFDGSYSTSLSSRYNIAASDKTPRDLAFYASPLIAVLIFCWFLLLACMVLAIGVCAMRGPRTKKRKRKEVERELELMRARLDEQDRMRFLWMQQQQYQQQHGLYGGYFGQQPGQPAAQQPSSQNVMTYPQQQQQQQQQQPQHEQQEQQQRAEMRQIAPLDPNSFNEGMTVSQTRYTDLDHVSQDNNVAGPSNSNRLQHQTQAHELYADDGNQAEDASLEPSAPASSKGKGKARAISHENLHERRQERSLQHQQ